MHMHMPIWRRRAYDRHARAHILLKNEFMIIPDPLKQFSLRKHFNAIYVVIYVVMHKL